MSRLEIIHLRSCEEPLESLGRRIRESLGSGGGQTDVRLYGRHGLETDVAVHMHHLGASEGEGPSSLGLRLASSLRAFGLVEHTTWGELK